MVASRQGSESNRTVNSVSRFQNSESASGERADCWSEMAGKWPKDAYRSRNKKVARQLLHRSQQGRISCTIAQPAW